MTKSELIKVVAEKSNQTQKFTGEVLEMFLDEITDVMAKGESIQFTGFGKFESRHRKERMGVNPQTQEPLKIAAKNVPAFKAGKKLKEAVK